MYKFKNKYTCIGIAKLVHTDGREMTINVEYNQLDPLLRATVSEAGLIYIYIYIYIYI
jgi:UDP-sugar pyrophosphorylase